LLRSRKRISERTQPALAGKKGKRMLGNRTNLATAQANGGAANRAAADTHALNVLPIIRQIEDSGITGGAERPRRAHARGEMWHDTTAQNLLKRRERSCSSRFSGVDAVAD
jgi:hypothetical protein